MRKLLCGMMAVATVGMVEAKTIHRSFRNGYPVVNGVPARQKSSAAVFKSPKSVLRKTVVVTNRVTLTKEQAEKLLKAKAKTGKGTVPLVQGISGGNKLK